MTRRPFTKRRVQPKRGENRRLGIQAPFSVLECALWTRLTGPRFAAQVAAAVSLVEAPTNHCKASTVANEVMAIMFGNKTGRSIEKFPESPYAGKHPKLITKGTKEAAAEAAVRPTQAGRGTCPVAGL
jgi:hypothetical protein